VGWMWGGGGGGPLGCDWLCAGTGKGTRAAGLGLEPVTLSVACDPWLLHGHASEPPPCTTLQCEATYPRLPSTELVSALKPVPGRSPPAMGEGSL
jgi:hypothetical protein